LCKDDQLASYHVKRSLPYLDICLFAQAVIDAAFPGAYFARISREACKKMQAQKIRFPDIDPAIAQAEATAVAPLSSAFKAAAFSIGAMLFFSC
jgi:hypothetical protein